MIRRLLFPVMVFVATVAWSNLPAWSSDEGTLEKPPWETYQVIDVQRTRVELRTHAVGSLRPRNKVIIPSPINGKVEWVIDEGTEVKKGDEVVRLDSTEYVERLEREKLDLAVVQAELERARLEEQLVQQQLALEVDKAALELELAQLQRDVLGEPTKTDVALSQLTVDQTRFAMDAAQKEYGRLQKLGEKGIESGRTIALTRLEYEGARADHLKAVADHELLLKGDPAEDIAVAEEQLERARTNLELARQRLESQAAFEATQVKVAEVAVKRIQSIIDLQQDRVDRSRVTAPADGTVILRRFRGVPLRAGDQVWGSNRLCEITAMSAMTVEAIVNQVDWRRIKLGQPVEIHMVAYPNKTFHGTVSKVGKLARDRSLILDEEITGVMSFYFEVNVAEQAPELQPSYTARVSVITDELDDCIAVPRAALDVTPEGFRVLLKTDEGYAWHEVQPGPGDATRIVIEKGLDENDRVVVPGAATAGTEAS